MKRTKSYLFAAMGLAVLVGSLVLAGAGSSNAAPGAQDVRVVNNVDNPVPTRALGTTNIAGNVGITGTPTFEVGNTAANPVWIRDADGVARQPFHAEGTESNDISGFGPIDFTVPMGKRLVITHISAEAPAPTGEFVRASFTYNLAGTLRTINLVMTSQGHFINQPSAPDIFATSQPMEIAADPGGPMQHNTFLQFRLSESAGLVAQSAHASISGYLVDMP